MTEVDVEVVVESDGIVGKGQGKGPVDVMGAVHEARDGGEGQGYALAVHTLRGRSAEVVLSSLARPA
jgi:hypothetical protein